MGLQHHNGSASTAALLTNVDNTISGAGLLGENSLSLVNEAAGVIDADDSLSLCPSNRQGLHQQCRLDRVPTGSGRLEIRSSSITQSGWRHQRSAVGGVVQPRSHHRLAAGRSRGPAARWCSAARTSSARPSPRPAKARSTSPRGPTPWMARPRPSAIPGQSHRQQRRQRDDRRCDRQFGIDAGQRWRRGRQLLVVANVGATSFRRRQGGAGEQHARSDHRRFGLYAVLTNAETIQGGGGAVGLGSASASSTPASSTATRPRP